MMISSYIATFWHHSHSPSAKKHLALNYIKSALWERCCVTKPASNMWNQMLKLTSVQPSKSSEMELRVPVTQKKC